MIDESHQFLTLGLYVRVHLSFTVQKTTHDNIHSTSPFLENNPVQVVLNGLQCSFKRLTMLSPHSVPSTGGPFFVLQNNGLSSWLHQSIRQTSMLRN